jgi:acyl-CoA thioesterase
MTATENETESAPQRRIAELHTLLDHGIQEGIGVGSSLGILVESLEQGRAVYALDPTPATINAMFTVHGGVLATLMDTAMGSAVYTCLDDGVYYTTLELKANFIRPARSGGPRLTCVGQTVHVGRRTATAEARVTDPVGTLIALASCTCMIFAPDKPTPATPAASTQA